MGIFKLDGVWLAWVFNGRGFWVYCCFNSISNYWKYINTFMFEGFTTFFNIFIWDNGVPFFYYEEYLI